jgi:hypothetical protein
MVLLLLGENKLLSLGISAAGCVDGVKLGTLLEVGGGPG